MCVCEPYCLTQVIEAAIEAGVEDVEVREGDEEGTSWILTDPKDLTHLAGGLGLVHFAVSGRDI